MNDTRLRIALTFLLTALSTSVFAQTSADRLVGAKAVRDGGDHDGALHIYNSLTDDPDPDVRAVALEGAAVILAWKGRYDDAIANYRKVAEISPEKRRDAVYGAARTLGWAHRYKEGLRELQELLEAHPDDTGIRLLEGQIAGWGGLTDRSVGAFRKVIELDPAGNEARLGLAKVLAWGGRLAESQKAFEDLLEREPDNDEARMGIVYTFLWQGRPHHAKRHFDLITAAGHESKEYKIVRVAVEWALMRRADSVAHRRALVRELPGEPDVRDLWRAQSGVIGHNVRGDATYLHDNEGLAVATASAGGSLRLGDPAFLFGDYRMEWLRQEGVAGGFAQDDVDVRGGRMGLNWSVGPVALRGSLGARTSDVDTGGSTFGLGLRTLLLSDLGIGLNLDSDFAFFTPKAVRSDARMTGLSVDVSKPITSRLGVTASYSRTHFEGPAVDQNRDLVNALLRFQAGGFGGDYGNVRVDLGARGQYFRFDRQYPDVGYWNPHNFRQAMGVLGSTYRKGETLTVVANASLGVQKQEDHEWELAAYLYAEGTRQVGRRTDLWVRADYSSSGFARNVDVTTGYRAWTVAGGILLRIGDRKQADRASDPGRPQPERAYPLLPPNP